MAWTKTTVDYDALLEDVESAREDVRRAARGVRHCSDASCDLGYVHAMEEHMGQKYVFARKHPCRGEYETSVARLRRAVIEYEQQTGDEYRNPMTEEMKYLGRPTGAKAKEFDEWKREFHRKTNKRKVDE